MALINMQQSAEEAAEDACCGTSDAAKDGPRYPYGLELRLDDESLAKLGMTSPPAVGTTMMVTARVTVTSASQYQTQGQEAESSSCWQITDMEVGAAPSSGDAASKLYG